jgi:hypothetical protein
MKLVDSIKAVATGNRQLITEPLYKIKLETDKIPTDCTVKFAREYSITVTLGANQWIAEDLIKSSEGKVIEYEIEKMKYMIAEEVYGELRRDLLNLQMVMRNQLDYYDNPCRQKLVEIIEKITL